MDGEASEITAMQRTRGFEHAVDAIADAHAAVLGFDVEVGGAALHGIRQQRINQPDHWLRIGLAVGRRFAHGRER